MKTPKIHNNIKVFELLNHYSSVNHAIADYPLLDAILFGVSRLDLGGNTRPISTGVLFTLLSHLEEVSTATVMQAHGCGERQAQNLAGMVRVASNAFQSYYCK